MLTILCIVIVVLLVLLIIFLFFRGSHYDKPDMSVQKKCDSILRKLNELEKKALALENDEAVERASCKRYVKQHNTVAAVARARKCLELYKQCQVYYSICRRMRFLLDEVNNAVTQKNRNRRELIPLVHNVFEALQTMNFGLIELYLDNFEQNFANENIKHQIRGTEIPSYIDVFKVIPEMEIDNFLVRMGHEIQDDEKAFMYKKIQTKEAKGKEDDNQMYVRDVCSRVTKVNGDEPAFMLKKSLIPEGFEQITKQSMSIKAVQSYISKKSVKMQKSEMIKMQSPAMSVTSKHQVALS